MFVAWPTIWKFWDCQDTLVTGSTICMLDLTRNRRLERRIELATFSLTFSLRQIYVHKNCWLKSRFKALFTLLPWVKSSLWGDEIEHV